MVCLTATEFEKLLNRLESAENRVSLLEDSLRSTESELKRITAERDALTKGYTDMKDCAKESKQ